jgi:hypothetical protein
MCFDDILALASVVVDEVRAGTAEVLGALDGKPSAGQDLDDREVQLKTAIANNQAELKRIRETKKQHKDATREVMRLSRLGEKAEGIMAKARAKAKEIADDANATKAVKAKANAKAKTSAAAAGAPAVPVIADADELDSCYHASFVTAELHAELCNFLDSFAPLEVQYRGHPVTSRPKRMLSLQEGEDDAFSIYIWGQVQSDYTLIEPMHPLIQKLANEVEDSFGHPRGIVNNAMATVYGTGREQFIPLHSDRAHSKEADGRVENFAPIYNTSFLATRTFVLADPKHIGKKRREEFADGILREWHMKSGDLVVLSPQANTTTVHGFPYEPEVLEKHVSLAFRHVTRNWVFQEDGIWKSYKVRADGGVYDLKVLGAHGCY